MTDQDRHDLEMAAFSALGMLKGMLNSGLLLPTFHAQAKEILAKADKAQGKSPEVLAAAAIAKAST